MPGHGTVINGTVGEDDATIDVDNNGGSTNYATGIQTALNKTGGTVTSGDVVEVDWNTRDSKLEINSIGSRATGNVNSEGTQITITDSGDTALSGTVNISTTYGDNEGFDDQTGVRCGNVNGKAAYLSS
ncbi:MAG: hypothetical protein QNK23_04150 [Crocinitomicaceae bacterium]|nr:hypothetical protein [Crocinitomicaceae bacterium]